MTHPSAENQHAPSTGQPGVVVTEIASGHGNLTAWANELVTAAVELARKHRLALVGGETRIITAQPESDFDHYFNATRRLNSEVDSLRQQLAAAQAEQSRLAGINAGLVRDYNHMLAEEAKVSRDRDQLRTEIVQLNELLRRRTEDRDRYETAEGTAVAQRNAALNEALGYKRQAEALREAIDEAIKVANRWPKADRLYVEQITADLVSAPLRAALDAASAGQPTTSTQSHQTAPSANDGQQTLHNDTQNPDHADGPPRPHPAEAPGE